MCKLIWLAKRSLSLQTRHVQLFWIANRTSFISTEARNLLETFHVKLLLCYQGSGIRPACTCGDRTNEMMGITFMFDVTAPQDRKIFLD